MPFELPNGWIWIRQSNLCWLDNGNKTQSGELPYLEAKVIRQNKPDKYQTSGVVVDSNFKLILVDGENSGEIFTPPFQGYMGSTFKILDVTLEIDFQYLLLIFELNLDLYRNSKTGAAIPHLNKKLFKENLIALPPLNEQQRIVKKLSEFDPLLERYQNIEKELSSCESTFEEKLKASILQYAIEGKLVKQDPNDEPASVLLERIKAEKEKLIQEGKIKRDKNDSQIPLGDDKNYYEKNIPVGWILAKIGQLGTLTRGFGIKRTDIIETGYPCIRYGELYTTYKFSFSYAVSYTSLEIWEKSFKVKENDILMTLTGENKKDISMALAYLGKDYIAYGGDMTCLSNHHMNPLYLVYAINSPYGRTCMQQLSTGDIIVHMSNDRLSKIILPIPPLNEQMKIVTKINQIFCLID